MTEQITLSPEKLKEIVIGFYYWWHNQSGNNTQDGYDEWISTKDISGVIAVAPDVQGEPVAEGELLPCPFCGQPPTEYDQVGYSSVKCHGCKFSIKVKAEDGPPYAPNLWNRRAAPDVQGEPVTEVSGETWSSDGTSDIIRDQLPIGTKLYAAPQPAEQPPRSDALIVKQTESIAVLLAKTFYGSHMENGEAYRDSKNLKAQQCWNVACRIQEELTCTDVENSVAELDEESPAEQQPAPDVADYEQVLDDKRRLTRELDVLLNGEEGAAKQASLCDLVAQLRTVVRQAGRPVLAAPDVAVVLERIDRELRPRSMCRDCADGDGRCDGGELCDPHQRADELMGLLRASLAAPDVSGLVEALGRALDFIRGDGDFEHREALERCECYACVTDEIIDSLAAHRKGGE